MHEWKMGTRLPAESGRGTGEVDSEAFIRGVEKKILERRRRRRMGVGFIVTLLLSVVVWGAWNERHRVTIEKEVPPGASEWAEKESLWLETDFESVPGDVFPEDYQWMAAVWLEPSYAILEGGE